MSLHAKELNDTSLQKLQSLEKKLGTVVVAWKKDPKPAALSEEAIKDLQSVEQELDAVLVAYST